MDFYIDETVYTGSPEDMSGRLPREVRTYALLDTLGIPFTRVDHDATATIDGLPGGRKDPWDPHMQESLSLQRPEDPFLSSDDAGE